MIKFIANIKVDEIGDWYIKLIDEESGKSEICKSIKELEEKIEQMGQQYGGIVDEVEWIKDDDVSDQCMNEIRMQMFEYKDYIEGN